MGVMSVAEKVFSDKPKSGAKKKEMVVDTARIIVNAMGAVSTGGQRDTWEKIGGSIIDLIDPLAGMLFPHSEKVERDM
jgi:hypothetical protein